MLVKINLDAIIKEALSITNVKEQNATTTINMIYAFIEDLKRLSNSDKVTFINKGHCSQSLRVGDYAITFGAIDEYEIEPDPFFSNAILCRVEYPDENFKIIVSLYLELPKRKKERIEMYNKIRIAHKRWYDVHLDNFGIVPKNFEHPFHNVEPEGLKYLGINNCFVERLEKGDTRLIDHGYVLPDDEEPSFIYNYNLVWSLECEYEKTKSL